MTPFDIPFPSRFGAPEVRASLFFRYFDGSAGAAFANNSIIIESFGRIAAKACGDGVFARFTNDY